MASEVPLACYVVELCECTTSRRVCSYSCHLLGLQGKDYVQRRAKLERKCSCGLVEYSFLSRVDRQVLDPIRGDEDVDGLSVRPISHLYMGSKAEKGSLIVRVPVDIQFKAFQWTSAWPLHVRRSGGCMAGVFCSSRISMGGQS